MLVSKYNASGNDFVIFHTFLGANRSSLARQICDRQNGIGADGLIVLLPNTDNSIKWEFYNNDGSTANMCANGSRAAFLYAYKNALITRQATLLTGAGVIMGSIYDDIVEVELTTPKKLSNITIQEFGLTWYFYDTGVPHLVTFVENLCDFDVTLARKAREKFNANVNYAMIKDDKIFVRTYERGVEDETFACGTGMAACFYAGIKNFNLKDKINVYPKSGEKLELRLNNGKILFSGRVKHTFDTVFHI